MPGRLLEGTRRPAGRSLAARTGHRWPSRHHAQGSRDHPGRAAAQSGTVPASSALPQNSNANFVAEISTTEVEVTATKFAGRSTTSVAASGSTTDYSVGRG